MGDILIIVPVCLSVHVYVSVTCPVIYWMYLLVIQPTCVKVKVLYRLAVGVGGGDISIFSENRHVLLKIDVLVIVSD